MRFPAHVLVARAQDRGEAMKRKSWSNWAREIALYVTQTQVVACFLIHSCV